MVLSAKGRLLPGKGADGARVSTGLFGVVLDLGRSGLDDEDRLGVGTFLAGVAGADASRGRWGWLEPRVGLPAAGCALAGFCSGALDAGFLAGGVVGVAAFDGVRVGDRTPALVPLAGLAGLAVGGLGWLGRGPGTARIGDRSGLVHGDTLEEVGVLRCVVVVVVCIARRVSSRMKEAESTLVVSTSFLGSSTPPSGMVRKHLMGVKRSGLVASLSWRRCSCSSLASDPSELYSGDFSRVVFVACGVGTSRSGEASLLVEPLSVSDDDFRVSSRVQVADDDTEVLLVLRRRPTKASLSSAVLEVGDASLVGLVRGDALGDAPGVPDLFFAAARDALDAKRRLSLAVVLLRRIVDESKVDTLDLTGDAPRGADGSLAGDALLPKLSGVAPRLVLRGDDGRDEGRDEAGELTPRVGVARADEGVGLARSALAKYWCVALRSWLMRLLL